MAQKLFFAASTTEFLNEDGDTREEHGWISPSWNDKELYANIEDVESTEIPDDQELVDFIESFFGAVEENTSGSGTFYYVDSRQDYESGKVYSYSCVVMEDDAAV